METNLSSQAFPDEGFPILEDVEKAFNVRGALSLIKKPKGFTPPKPPKLAMAKPKMPTVPGTKSMTPPKIQRVTKSYIPGKGWVKATEAGSKALRNAQGAHGNARGMTAEHVKVKDQMKAGRDFLEELKGDRLSATHSKTKRGNKVTTHTINQSDMDSTGLGAFTLYRGGRRGERHVVTAPNTPKFVEAHETAHTTPKRSNYRMSQITSDPAKVAREEARADWVAGQKYHKMAGPVRAGLKGEEQSAYASSAGHGSFRRNFAQRNKAGLHQGLYSRRNMRNYRTTQNKLDDAAGMRKDRLAWQARKTVPAVAAAGAGGTYAVKENKKRKVSKMAPDPSSLHVMGSPQGKKDKPPKYKKNVRLLKITN